MQDRLPLPGAAVHIAGLAVLPDGGDVPRDGAPAPDLPRIVRAPAAPVVAAVPLEPAAGILAAHPAVAPPHGERLRGVDAEAVERRVVPGGAQLRAREPALRELGAAIGHVTAAEYAELEHLP